MLSLALIIAGSTAFATQARYGALGGAKHLTDMRTVFAIPSDMMLLPESMEFNFGNTTVGSNTDGGMIKAMDEARLGFFLGAGDKARGNYLGAENPFSVAYSAKAGDMAWGVLFSYSASDKKNTSAATDDQTQSLMNLTGSIVMGDTTVALGLGLVDKAKGDGTSESNEVTQAPMELGVYHKLSDWTAYFTYGANTEKVKTATEAKTTSSSMELGAVHAMKSEGADFFYGLALEMNEIKPDGGKTSEMYLPIIFGIEADAASWLTLRGSVTQNVLLSSEKTTGGTPSGANTVNHNTTVNAGMGFKFTKATLDIALTSAATGVIDGSSFGANAGMTYLF